MFNNRLAGISIVIYNIDIACRENLLKQIDGFIKYGFNVVVFLNSYDPVLMATTKVLVSHETDFSNMGLGFAHNTNIEKLKLVGSEYFMTLDQDTIISEQCTHELFMSSSKLPSMYLIGPLLVDQNFTELISRTEKIKRLFFRKKETVDLIEVDKLIQSGMTGRISDWSILNGFDATLFIGEVDYEYCNRLKFHGGRVFKLNKCSVVQLIGLGRVGIPHFTVALHKPIRHYYYIRNQIRLIMDGRYPTRKIFTVIVHSLAVIILSPLAGKSFYCFSAVVSGICDGFRRIGGEKNG